MIKLRANLKNLRNKRPMTGQMNFSFHWDKHSSLHYSDYTSHVRIVFWNAVYVPDTLFMENVLFPPVFRSFPYTPPLFSSNLNFLSRQLRKKKYVPMESFPPPSTVFCTLLKKIFIRPIPKTSWLFRIYCCGYQYELFFFQKMLVFTLIQHFRDNPVHIKIDFFSVIKKILQNPPEIILVFIIYLFRFLGPLCCNVGFGFKFFEVGQILRPFNAYQPRSWSLFNQF